MTYSFVRKTDSVDDVMAADVNELQVAIESLSQLSGGINLKGDWDASTAAYPVGPTVGDMYIIIVAGTIEGTAYAIGDLIVWDAVEWIKIPLALSITGALTFKGIWDASTEAYPADPDQGDYYVISVAGTISGTAYIVGDIILYNGTDWEKTALGVDVVQNLNDLSDVDTTGVADGNALVYDLATTSWIPGEGGGGITYICQGRLTLETGVPVSTADQADKTNLYFTPYNGNLIDIYDGTDTWVQHTFTERTLAVGSLTASKPYDIVIYDNAGTLTLEGVVWTNATTRATALTTQDGVYVLTGATNKRYLGTIYIDSGQKCQDTISKRFVWNLYNQVPRRLFSFVDAEHTYNGNERLWNNSTTNNQLEIVTGITRNAASFSLKVRQRSSSAGTWNRSLILQNGTNPGAFQNDGNQTASHVEIGNVSVHNIPIGLNVFNVYQTTYTAGNAVFSDASMSVLVIM